jgi:hypothetical protein
MSVVALIPATCSSHGNKQRRHSHSESTSAD